MNRSFMAAWCCVILSCLPEVLDAQSPWSGIINSSRATDWTTAGIPGGIPSGSWTQCGATIAAYGTSGSPGSPATINNAIAGTGAGYTGCSTPYVIQLGTGDFYLNASINLRSNVVLRGGGANSTRIHLSPGGSYSCNGLYSATCLVGSNTYTGYCNVSQWPCPAGQFTPGYQHSANWTGGYAQGATSITLDDVAGIVPNVTPIALDQCDTGFTGSPGVENCTATAGVITSATVYPGSGGSGYAVNDTGTISPPVLFGRGYGSGTATYKVTSVSGGAVTGFTITNGGSGYTYTNVNSYFGTPTATTKTSGSGSGFGVQITGITGYDNNGLFICAIEMICSNLSDSGTARIARSQSETVVATSITGTGPYIVTLSRPLMNPNWASGQSPQAWWGSATITNAGIEDLLLDMSAFSAGASAVTIQSASYVWVKGIASNTANYFHILATVACNFVVRDSYFYYTTHQGTTSYGLGSGGVVSRALFENNIIQGVVDPLVANGACTGCVFDYNFSVNDADSATSAMFASSPMHSTATNYILEEGNIGAGTYLDNTHGPHSMNTFYRNYFNGYEQNEGVLPYQATTPAIVGAFSRYNQFIANVLGTPGYHTVYECLPASPTQQYCSTDAGTYPGAVHIWDVGFSSDAQIDFTNTPSEPNDPLTASSLMRWGNWDNVRGVASWCGNSADTGWSTTCGGTSEVPTGDPHYPNSVPTLGDTGAGQGALPASFLYSSKPSWWPSSKAWPAIGPDVTTGNIGQCTGGTYTFSKVLSGSSCTGGAFLSATSTNGSHVVSIPAMDCYLNVMGGPPNGTGGILSFNANTCYGSGSASPPNLSITSPANGTYTTTGSIAVGGTASSASGVQSVKVNGTAATTSNAYANWTATASGLAVGNNTISVIATDNSASHLTTTQSVSVIYASGTYDGNGDGLPDAWQIQYFGNGFVTNPQAAPTANPSGDGTINLLKYAFGMDPAVASTNALPTTAIQNVGGTKYLTITFHQRPGGSSAVTYTVQTSPDLTTWSNAGVVQIGSATPDANGITQTVTFRDSVASSSATRRFIRVKVN